MRSWGSDVLHHCLRVAVAPGLGLVWDIPAEKCCLQLLCQKTLSRLMESILGISHQLDFGFASGRRV